MKFPREFLEKMALDQGLSPDQEEVFILRFAYQEEYRTIAGKLKTTSGACLKRMGQIYKKFKLEEGGRGKESRLKSKLLEEYQQWERLDRQQQANSATASLSLPARASSPDSPLRLESPGSPLSWDSPFYIERLPNEEFYYQEIIQPGALINIKAPQKTGKTSLMNRILKCAENEAYHIVNFDLELVGEKALSQLETFLKWFCTTISKKLNLDSQLADLRDEDFDKIDCETCFENLLTRIEKPLVLGLDNIDRLFNHPEIAEDFCSLLRSFHESGKQSLTWEKLRLVLAYSPGDFPIKPYSSPFNVGLGVELPELTDKQVGDLAQLHGLNWNDNQVKQLMDMVGGNPYLIRLALFKIARQEITFDELLKTAPTEAGIYRSYLGQHLEILKENPELCKSLKRVIDSQEVTELDSKDTFKLQSIGLVKLIGNGVTVSCGLYRDYFREHLREIE